MMKRMIALLALSTVLAACGETDGSEPADPTGDSTDTSKTAREASLERALPDDGSTVQGEFALEAVIDSEVDVEARFLLDGTEVAVVNQAPYSLSMSSCDLSEGNHAYIVEIVDENGHRDFAQQWFWVEGCDQE